VQERKAMYQQNLCTTSSSSVERARTRRVELYRASDQAGTIRYSAAEGCPEGRWLGEPKATELEDNLMEE
jgi:hypothetical protein